MAVSLIEWHSAQDQAHALVELAHATLRHGGLITTVDLGDVVALDVGILGTVDGEETGEGHLFDARRG